MCSVLDESVRCREEKARPYSGIVFDTVDDSIACTVFPVPDDCFAPRSNLKSRIQSNLKRTTIVPGVCVGNGIGDSIRASYLLKRFRAPKFIDKR